MTDELTWEPPGPGTWFWDAGHASRPTSKVVQELLPGTMRAGFPQFTAPYGLPIDHIVVRYVNEYGYTSVQLANLGEREVPPPVAAEQAFASRRWREELRWWEEEERPAFVETRRRLQGEDLRALDDAQLAAHVDAVATAFTHGMTTHFKLVGAAAIPVGDFLAHCRSWGLPRDECLAVLVAEHPLTRARREASTVDDFMDTIGYWMIGRYDVTGRTMREEPGTVDAAFNAALPPVPSADSLRDKVPERERHEFDELLTEARTCFSARDDHATIGGLWSMGLIRHALLEAGRRLGVDNGVFELSCSEVAAALRGELADVSAIVGERAERSAVAAAASPPPMLGDGAGGPPSFELPGALGRAVTAMFTYLDAMNGNAQAVGIGNQVVRGRAVVAIDPEDAFDRIEPGDILVTMTTTPAFGAVFPLLGGVVAATGGPLSHTAIVARELGLPAVVGVADALGRIADGSMIELDAAAGEVRVV